MKNILITGASRGIGEAIAKRFAQEPNNIIINSSKSSTELLAVKNDIEAMGCSCMEFIGDIGEYNTCQSLFDKIQNRYGGVDILINNAGISYIGLLTDMSICDWDKIVKTNLTSIFNCCRLAVPHMVAKKSGKILNISSVWGEVGASCEVAYSATKGGVNSFTKALAKELAPSNIQVNAICCGAIDTSMNHFLSDEDAKALEEEIPIGRMGTTKEVADLAFEICHSSPYLTGQLVRLDGGWI